MKKIISIIVLTFILSLPLVLTAQPPHPNGGQTPEDNGNTPVGGGAPIGSATILLALLATTYGSIKAYTENKQK